MSVVLFAILSLSEAFPVSGGSSVSDKTQLQSVPLLGLGNELVWQSLDDPTLVDLARSTAGRVGRYPGGTPSDYWLWDHGWVNKSSDHSGSGNLPVRTATPAQWATWAREVGGADMSTVLVVNQLQSSLEYQLKGLEAHESAGTPVRFVELGNEMYDSSRPDVLAEYPSPTDYAVKMGKWTAAIRQRFPNASVALVGSSWPGDTRSTTWNNLVLNASVSSGATSATLHLYAGLGDLGTPIPDAGNLSAILNSTNHWVDTYTSYIESTVPSRYDLWITEWGTWGNDPMRNTWLQGLWHVAFVLRLTQALPHRITTILPYCLVCADPNMPGALSPTGPIRPVNSSQDIWTETPSGYLYGVLFGATHDAALLAPLGTSSSSPALAGWVLYPSPDAPPHAAVALNLGGAPLWLDAPALLGDGFQYKTHRVGSLEDVISTTSKVVVSSGAAKGQVSLAPFSATVFSPQS